MAALAEIPYAAETIVETMQALLELHRECLGLGREKMNYLMQGDLSKIESIVGLEQTIIHEIERQEDRRMLALRKLLGDSPELNKDWRLDTVLCIVPPDIAEVMRTLRAELLQVMDELRDLNRKNQRLTKLSLAYVDYMVNVITGTGAEESSTYAPLRCAVGDGAKESLLIDWKA